MDNDIAYEMMMFGVVENIVQKNRDAPRAMVRDTISEIVDVRKTLWAMDDDVAEYDSRVIHGLFDLLWPKENDG